MTTLLWSHMEAFLFVLFLLFSPSFLFHMECVRVCQDVVIFSLFVYLMPAPTSSLSSSAEHSKVFSRFCLYVRRLLFKRKEGPFARSFSISFPHLSASAAHSWVSYPTECVLFQEENSPELKTSTLLLTYFIDFIIRKLPTPPNSLPWMLFVMCRHYRNVQRVRPVFSARYIIKPKWHYGKNGFGVLARLEEKLNGTRLRWQGA